MEKKGDRLVWSQHPEALIVTQKHKMSKSRGNVVNPDDVVYRYGADSLRLYEMFLGPLQDTKVCILHDSCVCAVAWLQSYALTECECKCTMAMSVQSFCCMRSLDSWLALTCRNRKSVILGAVCKNAIATCVDAMLGCRCGAQIT